MALTVSGTGATALRPHRRRARSRDRVAVVLCDGGPVALLAAVCVNAVVPDLVRRAAVPIAVGAIVLGIPHGAVDHMLPFWVTGRSPRVRDIARVLVQYLLIAAVAVAAFVVVPEIAFLVFVVASVVHFGQADETFAVARTWQGPDAVPRTGQWLRTVAHGGTVVVLPFAIWPDQVRSAIGSVAPGLFSSALRPAWIGAGLLVAALAIIVTGLELRAEHPVRAGETALLLTAVLALPPVVAFAVYFGAWHSLRHTARLLALPGARGHSLATRDAVRRFLVHAAAPTLGAVVALIVLMQLGSRPALSVAVSLLLALTFPHMRTVAAWDRQAAVAALPLDRTEFR